MIVELIGRKGELARDSRTGERLVRFDNEGRATVTSTQFTPFVFEKLLRNYKHIIIEKTDEEKKIDAILAKKKAEKEKEVKKVVEEKKEEENSLEKTDVAKLREKAKELKIRNWHNLSQEKLIEKIKEKE